MNCTYCNSQLPDKAFFCPDCTRQVKCRECSESLVKDAKICINCGESLGGKKTSENKNINTFEFSETLESRQFKASFTDTVGNNFSEAIGLLMTSKVGAKPSFDKGLPPSHNASDEPVTEEAKAIIVDNVEIPEVTKLKSIFNDDGQGITLSETRLKASSKREYGQRITLLFAYHRFLQGKNKVPKKDLNAIVKDASVYDGNFRTWLVNNPLINANGDDYEIKAPGKDEAKRFLKEINDSTIPDGWHIGGQKIRKAKKTKDKD